MYCVLSFFCVCVNITIFFYFKQEEYAFGDEVGRLECEHGYHVVCINQWLRLKNWCPICKASAAASQSSSPN